MSEMLLSLAELRMRVGGDWLFPRKGGRKDFQERHQGILGTRNITQKNGTFWSVADTWCGKEGNVWT